MDALGHHISGQMVAGGIETPPADFVADGNIHRFVSMPGHNATGWYVIHPDPGGAVWIFGDWRLNIKVKGNGAADGPALSQQEIKERDKRIHKLQAKITAEKERFQAGAAIEARERWDNAPPAPPLGLLAPPSSAKTEILNALSRLDYVEPTATVTPAALLSGTPKRHRSKGSQGGLLAKLGKFGIMVLKDFGSILSMRPESKAEILAALREIYDGSWTRHVGTDGGMTLSWAGKMGLIFGATQAYDDHHSVIGSLGDRFLLCRLPSLGRGQLNRVLDHTGGATKVMRDELAAAVAGLFVNELREPPRIDDAEIKRLDDIVSLAVLLRAHVNRDRYRREIESIHGAEGVGRMGLSLERLLGGLTVIGVERAEAMHIVENIALDSVPPVRRHAFELLDNDPVTTRDIARGLKLPTNTARRALEDLAAHGLAIRTRAVDEDTGEEKQTGADRWRIDPEWANWRAMWAAT